MAQGRMEFDFTLSTPRTARHAAEDQPMRILALADLSGHSAARQDRGLAQRKPLAVDIDNLDQLFAKLAPRLRIDGVDGAPGGGPITLEFASLEDFHPDRLWRSAAFSDLRALRSELMNPATYARAAAALGAPPAAAAETTAAKPADASGDIERLLGRAPSPAAEPSGAAAAVQRLLRDIVAPHIVHDTTPQQQQLMAALDAAIGQRMRQLLHHPSFQALEAAWRGVHTLVTGVELGETLQLALLDVSRDELQADLRQCGGDLSGSALFPILCGPETAAPDGVPWSVIVCDFSFGAEGDDVALIAALGALGASAGAPALAAADSAVLGCTSSEGLPEPKTWQPLDAESAARWRDLRRSSVAPWLGLALPRVLGRLPYGKKLDAVESFEFEEIADGARHDTFLWINPAWFLALLVAQGYTQEGWAMSPDRYFEIADLPSYIFKDADGEVQQQPCAEVLMGEAAGEAALRHGIMPVLSYRGRDAARLLRWQSLAEPPAALSGAWA
jgi:type VI secretion system protein ImpC